MVETTCAWMMDCLEQTINEICLLTLAQINHELSRRLPVKPKIHDHTIVRTLDGMVSHPADRNRPDVLNKQVDCTTWLMNNANAITFPVI